MTRLLSLILLTCFASCAPVYLVDKTEFRQIPKGVKRIVVEVPYSSDSLFKVVSRNFSRDGWVIKTDKESMQISAEAKSVGAGTSLKPLVYIEGSKAYYSGEWGLDQQGQLMMQSMVRANTYASQPIIFEKSGTTKNDVAFQGLLVLAKKVPGGSISYQAK